MHICIFSNDTHTKVSTGEFRQNSPANEGQEICHEGVPAYVYVIAQSAYNMDKNEQSSHANVEVL